VFFFFQIFISYLIPLANNAFWHATLKLILLNDGMHVSFIFVAYVESMKSLFFTLPKAVMKEVFERFSAKRHQSLSTLSSPIAQPRQWQSRTVKKEPRKRTVLNSSQQVCKYVLSWCRC